MADTLKLEIITPDAVAYSQVVEMVSLPGVEGQLGILPRHTPLMTRMVPGEVIVKRNGTTEYLAVGAGMIEVTADRVALLTDMAVGAENIDAARVEEARQRAAARLREKLSDEEVASVNAALAKSLAQLRVKRRHHG